MSDNKWMVTTIGLVLAVAIAAPAPGQLRRLRDVVKDTAEREVERKVAEETSKAIQCMFDDLECIKKAEERGEEVVYTDAKGSPTDSAGRPVAPQSDPEAGEGDSNLPAGAPPSTYDFEAGTRVIFEEDFAGDTPGDFPRGLEFIAGNMQVVEWSGRRFIRADSKNSRFAVVLPETLPERFTIEFDLHDAHSSQGLAVALSEPLNFGWAWDQGYEYHYFSAARRQGAGVWGGQGKSLSVTQDTSAKDGVVSVAIMVDGEHAKMFVDQKRVANAPRVNLPRTDRLYFFLEPITDRLVYIADIRVAAGGRDLYDALEADGRVSVHDILFDTGKATIRPESAAILADIGAMLTEHPDLRLLIEGHTDNVGGFELNMPLSGERAEAVKTYLVEELGIDGQRLMAMGLGMSRPTDTNDTEEGRQKNRRVELVRM